MTRLFGKHYGWKTYFESVDNNPYLNDFYGDMKKWSFHLQIYFLSKRFNDHKKILDSKFSCVEDRSIYEDVEIFAKNLFDIENMSERDYKNYCELFSIMTTYLKPPDLLIYLDASIETLLKQIKKRGRDYEQSIPKTYLEQLSKLYDEWIKNYKLGNLLIIPSDEIDFVYEKGDFNRVLMLIQSKLFELGYKF